ncbi:MAG: DUF1801 domain-containing protein [Thermoanaerobaculia bacterium]
MVSSAASTVLQYLSELPLDRRIVVAEIRRVILENLPTGYVETMNWGMLAYEIPLARYPDTYNGKPLAYVALAAQKNKFSLYLTGPYMFGDEAARAFREGFEKAGKKLDMGKSCVRFRRVEDLALDVIAASIASVSVDDYIRRYEEVRAAGAVATRPPKKKAAERATTAASAKPPTKKVAAGSGARKSAAKRGAAKKSTVKKATATKRAAGSGKKPAKKAAGKPAPKATKRPAAAAKKRTTKR